MANRIFQQANRGLCEVINFIDLTLWTGHRFKNYALVIGAEVVCGLCASGPEVHWRWRLCWRGDFLTSLLLLLIEFVLVLISPYGHF